jgi:predicted transposase YdaD
MVMPHDKLAKAVFSQLEHAKAELSSVLPAAVVEKIDWSTLVLVSGEFVDPSLAHLNTDLLYTVRLGSRTACIYVLLEHMSTVERMMPFRLLRYMTKIWSRFEQDNPGKPLPLIIPVVLHHSDKGWTAPVRFGELFEVDDVLRSVVSPFVPDFGFVLDDLTKVDDEALRARAVSELVRLTLLVLQRCRDADDPVGILRPWMDTIVAVLTAPNGVEALSAVAGYIMEASEGRPEELGAFFRELGPKAEEAYVTAAEKLTAQVRAKALEQGRAEGRAEGEAKGQATMLLKQLGLRFGPLSDQVRARVQSAGPDELDRWAEKVLSAATLEELLDA